VRDRFHTQATDQEWMRIMDDPTKAFSLAGRRAVLVGAATGIGRQAAITFAQAGASVTIADVNATELDRTAELVRDNGGQVETKRVDVRDPEGITAFADFAASEGAIDVWVNAAGVISLMTVAETDPAELDRILDINLKGVFWCCAAAVRKMLPQRRGSIINISSCGADMPTNGLSAYTMSKAAVNMLTRTLAVEAGHAGIRVNAVAPGFIDTPMVEYRFRNATGEIDPVAKERRFAEVSAMIPLGRVGKPDDIAMTMLYLASDASSFVTGQVIRPNGGMIMP